jgi:tyrosyl-tRNA synthetase
MGLFENLQERGFTYQLTHDNEIKNSLNGKPITFYLGIDPTADSLHIGHFFALRMFRKLQDAGHKGILVIGGATALVGDPSGRSDMRKMITKEEVEHNLQEVKELSKKFIRTDGDNPAIILNNADWINSFSYIDFLRKVGTHFNVGQMLSADCYKTRLEEGGLTFLEMGYMLMQAYDFVKLNEDYGCNLQIGGSDQWGNITAGTMLNRKLKNLENTKDKEGIFGLTCPLLMTKDGKKMGKTANGTLWVARDKTTVFDFYQYFYNVKDEDVELLLKLFTDIDSKVIDDLLKNDIVKAKRIMAYETTKLVHGKEEADKVLETVKKVFQERTENENMPTYKMPLKTDNRTFLITDIAFESGLTSSKSEARKLIEQGGLYVNDKKIEDIKTEIDFSKLKTDHIILRKGKKSFMKITFGKTKDKTTAKEDPITQ